MVAAKVVGDYEVHGFNMLDGEGALFLIITAMTSYVAESMVENVLADNRVASKYLEYREDVEHEIDSLQMVPKLLWSWLCALLPNTTEFQLCDKTCRSCHGVFVGGIGTRN
eukprot:2800650-Amphidinium_carterae.1